jgi:hypothetical protein
MREPLCPAWPRFSMVHCTINAYVVAATGRQAGVGRPKCIRDTHRRSLCVLYTAYELSADCYGRAPGPRVRGADFLNNPTNCRSVTMASRPGHGVGAGCLRPCRAPRGKPAFGIERSKSMASPLPVTEAIVARTALRQPAALHPPEGLPEDEAAAADRRADERPFRHAAARHRRADAAERMRCVTSPTGPMRARWCR